MNKILRIRDKEFLINKDGTLEIENHDYYIGWWADFTKEEAIRLKKFLQENYPE